MIPNVLKGRLFEDDDQFHLSISLLTKIRLEPAYHIYVLSLYDAPEFFSYFLWSMSKNSFEQTKSAHPAEEENDMVVEA